jgi:hypothetical protein
MCTIATLNIAGYDTYREIERVGAGQRYLSKHEDIELYMENRIDDGAEVVFMGLQETWLHDGEEMEHFTEHESHTHTRTVPHVGGGRYHGGTTLLNHRSIDYKCEVWRDKGYGGSEGVQWQCVGGEGGARGHVGNVYFDDEKYQKRAGICADAMWEALKNDVHRATSKGWVILMGDWNGWLGQEEDAAGGGRSGYGTRHIQRSGRTIGGILEGDWTGVAPGASRRARSDTDANTCLRRRGAGD